MDCSEDVGCEFVDLSQQVSLKADVELSVVLIKIVLELIVRHLVTSFVFSISFVSLLYRVIRQMNQSVGQVVNVILVGACSDISFFVEVALLAASDGSQHGIGSDVEFAPVDQKRVVDVPLYYASSSAVVLVGFGYQVDDFVVILGDLDAVTAVGVFTRFDNPYVLWNNQLFVIFDFLAICFLRASFILSLFPDSPLLLD